MASKIPWTDETYNPVVGCSKVSAGCQNCYAEKMAVRQYCMANARCRRNRSQLNLVTAMAYGKAINRKTGKWTGDIGINRWHLDKPLHWKKPRRIFACSMGDLFHESVPFEFILKVFRVIEQCPQHTFQILTKRPEVMFDFFGGESGAGLSAPVLPNLWLGVTCENQKMADKRIPILLQIPAAVRYVSVEPMLGPVDMEDYLTPLGAETCHRGEAHRSKTCDCRHTKLDWVIIGPENGPKRRPFKVEWARDLVAQCDAAGVPVFIKPSKWLEWTDDLKNRQDFPKE